jgi:hypothetical protein
VSCAVRDVMARPFSDVTKEPRYFAKSQNRGPSRFRQPRFFRFRASALEVVTFDQTRLFVVHGDRECYSTVWYNLGAEYVRAMRTVRASRVDRGFSIPWSFYHCALVSTRSRNAYASRHLCRHTAPASLRF